MGRLPRHLLGAGPRRHAHDLERAGFSRVATRSWGVVRDMQRIGKRRPPPLIDVCVGLGDLVPLSALAEGINLRLRGPALSGERGCS